MRIAWWSNATWARTGYGGQSAQVIKRLRADGHEVGVQNLNRHRRGRCACPR